MVFSPSHLWRLANWVEEVQDISKRWGASFHHIVREANVVADSLAREGGFRSSIYFDA